MLVLNLSAPEHWDYRHTALERWDYRNRALNAGITGLCHFAWLRIQAHCSSRVLYWSLVGTLGLSKEKSKTKQNWQFNFNFR